MTQDVPPPPRGSMSPPQTSPIKSPSLDAPTSRTQRRQSSGLSSVSPTKSAKRPLGPRSPRGSHSEVIKSASMPPPSQNTDELRNRPGSSRTSVYTSSRSQTLPTSVLGREISDAPAEEVELVEKIEADATYAPYRPPEAVIEPLEEHPPGYVPGVIEEHMDDDDNFVIPISPLRDVNDLPKQDHSGISQWQSQVSNYRDGGMDLDEPFRVERPQIGPGVLPRRWLQIVHEHELFMPAILDLPQRKVFTPKPAPTALPSTSKPPSDSSLPKSPPPTTIPVKPKTPVPADGRIYTKAELRDAAPGGALGRREWYFCTECWAWMRIKAGRGPLPEVADMAEWEMTIRSGMAAGVAYPGIDTVDDIPAARLRRQAECGRFNDIVTSRQTADKTAHHLHEFRTLLDPGRESRLERIPVINPQHNAFPHLDSDLQVTLEPAWEEFVSVQHPPRLYVSCSSDFWIQVDEAPIAGQIPKALVTSLFAERHGHPPPGVEPRQSVLEAWNLMALVAGNYLFKGSRGWVSMETERFKKSLSMTPVVSTILYHLGFGCKQEADCLRVGPFLEGGGVTASDVQQMDRYLLRSWLEIQIYKTALHDKWALESSAERYISLKPLDKEVEELGLQKNPQLTQGYPDNLMESMHALGVTLLDKSATIELAYDLQVSCDSRDTPKYLSALQKVSNAQIIGAEGLQMKLMIEQSMGKFTSEDLVAAYEQIGYNKELAEQITVDPEQAPDTFIYELHKKATQAAQNQSERNAMGKALALIGRSRGSDEMRVMGETGQTMMSVDDAYNALSAPKNAVDDGLIMQYEMAVSEYPGKKDHYRTCLSIIAEAQGAERPGIKTFLETGALYVAPPPRNDIPVGLQNIGNTCYLNSILQYLYSTKPLRDAVIDFEQDLMEFVSRKAEAERSRRFVRQLRLLFLQLYKSDQSAVRPDEELAYLAITRPEVDAIVEPAPSTVAPAVPAFSSIPDRPSPSSTRVATPTPSQPFSANGSPEIVDIPLPSEQADEPNPFDTTASILGKRQSQDRDSFSDTSPAERARHRSEGFETVEPVDQISEGYEMIKAESPSAVTDIADLSLIPRTEGKSTTSTFAEALSARQSSMPPLQTIEQQDEDVVMFDAPNVPPPLPGRPHTRRGSTLASGLRFGLQQDSAEVLINVLSQLELAFDPSVAEGEGPGRNIISELFSCKYKQQMFFEAAEGNFQGQAPVESVFVHPIIGVEEEGKDLYDCLGELYLRGSEIEYEGKKGYIMDLMDQFPPMLYIQMRRSQYDIATGRERKTNTHVPFTQTLQMDRFLASANAEKRNASIHLTRTMTDTRARLHQLQDRKPLSMPATFKHVREALQQIQDMPELDISADFVAALQGEEKRVEGEIERLRGSLIETKAKLDEVWRDKREMEYELVAVFMHRGKTSGAGHYWTYQAHLPDHPETFFKYNDETVTEVPAAEVLQDRTGDDANPALLCYVRKGQSLVDTLHREILEQAAPALAVADEGVVAVDDVTAETSISLI